MITNDFLKGYVQALDNVDEFLNTSIKEKKNSNMDSHLSLISVKTYIKQVRENYKTLVKDLNKKDKK